MLDITRIHLFQGLTNQEYGEVQHAHFAYRRYPAGEYIIRQGERSSALYVLMAGTAQVTRGLEQEHFIANLVEGAIFGEISFLTARLRSTHVKAVEDSVVLRIDSELLNAISADAKDKIKNRIIELLIDRLDNMNHTLSEISRQVRTADR
ncbi:MAG: cyclic nucleotide-binding domain-containing protein [Magnetococcales bacterium]|nr:cyclic nucleotide-binding domain-containing protein [Magnetococcales bacterium]